MNLNRVNKVLVTNVTAANTGTSLETIVAGDVLVMNKKFANLTGTPTPSSADGNESIYIALGIGAGKALLSSEIKSANVTAWQKYAWQAPVEQTSFVGYNGTSGALALANSTSYRLRIQVKDRHRFRPHLPTEFDYHYETGASADNLEAALDFAKRINADTRGLRAKFQAEVRATGTLTEFPGTADATVTNGSTAVTTAAAHGVTVGAYVTFGTTPVVYKVVAVPTTTSLTLDRPYTGATETIDIDTTTDEATVLTSPTAVGLAITALAIPTKTYSGGMPLDSYQQMQFSVGLGPVNGTPDEAETVTTTDAVPGRGYWEQVRDMEFAASGYLGYMNKTMFPVDTPTIRAVEGNQYDVYVIEHFEEINTGQGVYRDPITTVIAFESSTTTKMDAVDAILNSWMAAAKGLANL